MLLADRVRCSIPFSNYFCEARWMWIFNPRSCHPNKVGPPNGANQKCARKVETNSTKLIEKGLWIRCSQSETSNFDSVKLLKTGANQELCCFADINSAINLQNFILSEIFCLWRYFKHEAVYYS